MKKIPIIFKNTGLSETDKNQLELNLDRGSRILLNLLTMRLGKNKAKDFKIYVTASDPVPAVLQEKTATPAITQVVVTPSTGYDGMSKVTVEAVTAAIDANIVAGNIKSGVVILGVTGTYTGE